MVAIMGSIYKVESMTTARAMAAYGNQVRRKASTMTTTIRATCTSTRFVLPPSATCNLVTWEMKDKPTDWGRQFGFGGTFSLLCAHLAEGPQEPRVRHGNNGERHSKAKQQVCDDVGLDPHIAAVPVRSTGGSDPLKVKTSPPKKRRCVPHE